MTTYQVPVLGGAYILDQKLGQGSYGTIYHGWSCKSNSAIEVAVKLEDVNAKKPQLKTEFRVYTDVLQEESNQTEKSNFVPMAKMYHYKRDGDFRVLVMDVLGPSLRDYFEFRNHSFSLKTTLLLTDQIISAVQYIHERDYVHRDIKPSNLLFGVKANYRNVYLIDFGLALKYRDSITKTHMQPKEGRESVGCISYSSFNSCFNRGQTRRDDLESIAFVSIFFLKNTLPWFPCKDSEEVRKVKMVTPVEVITEKCPDEFSWFVSYCRGLRFEESPDYDSLRDILKVLQRRKAYGRGEDKFDWEK